MKKTYSFPRYVTLNTKTAMLGLLGRAMWLFALFILLNWRAVGAPLAGIEWFAIIMSVTLTTIIIAGFYLSNRALHRLFRYYKQSTKSMNKFLVYILYMIAPIPLLELKWLFSDNIDREETVLAFLQPNPKGTLSLFRSIIHFFLITEPDAQEIADLIRKKSNYFATSRDGEKILISTNNGVIVCLIGKSGKLYMFTRVDATQQPLAISSNWKLEYSQDKTEAAVVFKRTLDPTYDMDSNTLAEVIIAAINNLLNKE